MTITISKLFAPVQLGTSASTVYTCPATPATTLKNARVRLSNNTGGAVNVTLHAVPAAGSPSATTMFLSVASIAANAYLDTDIPTLGPGDMLQALASAAASVSIHEIGGVLSS